MGVKWADISLFQGYEPEELERIKALFQTTTREPGENLIVEGEGGDEMYVLVKGRVKITKAMIIKGMQLPLQELRNPRKVLATLDQTVYPIFGEMAMIDRDIRSATVTILDSAEFLYTHRDDFFEFINADPALGVKLLLAISRRLAATVRRNNGELIKLTTALALSLSHK